MLDCALQLVAMAVGSGKVKQPDIMAMGHRRRSKGMLEQRSNIRVWAGTRLHPDLGVGTSVRNCSVRPATSSSIDFV